MLPPEKQSSAQLSLCSNSCHTKFGHGAYLLKRDASIEDRAVNMSQHYQSPSHRNCLIGALIWTEKCTFPVSVAQVALIIFCVPIGKRLPFLQVQGVYRAPRVPFGKGLSICKKPAHLGAHTGQRTERLSRFLIGDLPKPLQPSGTSPVLFQQLLHTTHYELRPAQHRCPLLSECITSYTSLT